MHDYLLSTEVIRFAFVLGVAVSMLMYERRHLTTGSIVVPGYIAVFIVYPFIIIATFLNAALSYIAVNKVLRRWFLLYGRTKFTILALISIVIQTLMLKLTPSGPWLWESDLKLFVGVGYIVPALIAHDMGRQGVAKTLKSVLMAAGIVATPIAIALAFDVPGVNDLAPLQGIGDMAIDPAWIPLAVLLSAAAAWGVAHNYGLRSGGFVGAAFIGMMLGDPWQVVTAIVIAIATYIVVTKLLMTSMILFGRRKFSTMLLVSSSLAWCLLWTGTEFFGEGMQQHLDLGSLALTPLFIPGLLANDSQRTSPLKVATGVTLAGSFVLATTWWAEALFEGLHLSIWWKLLSVVAFGAIFWRQFVPVRTEERSPAAASDHEARVAEAPLVEAPAPTEAPVPTPAPEPAPVAMPTLATGRSGFERWATTHRDAAQAAEEWLASVLGENRPAAATTANPPTMRTRDQPERSTLRLREAAERARARTGGLPVQQRRTAHNGEFDTVATGIAAGVRRPRSLPRRERGAALGRAQETPVSDDVLQAARVQLDLLPQTQQFTEAPGAGSRAHPAPGARYSFPKPSERGIGPLG